MLEGEVTLITNAGEEIMRTGDAVGFRAGVVDGHHFINTSDKPAVLLEIGTRNPEADTTTYPDIDLMMPAGRRGYTHKDGTPY